MELSVESNVAFVIDISLLRSLIGYEQTFARMIDFNLDLTFLLNQKGFTKLNCDREVESSVFSLLSQTAVHH